MAWIESHQALKDHPKTAAMCEHLGAKRPQVVGHLHLLWWWCIDYAPDGNLTKYTPTQISRAAEWDGDPASFFKAMVATGFIEQRKNTIRLHDWHHYCGALMERRLKRMEAKRPPVEAERPPTNHTVPTIPVHKARKAFEKPTPEDVTAYAKSIGFDLDGHQFVDHYEARGWKYKAGQPMVDWKAAVRTWKKNRFASVASFEPSQHKVYWVWKVLRETNKVIEKLQFPTVTEAHARCEKLKDELDPDVYSVEVR